MHKDKKAFTLFELIIVIAIVGLLISVVLAFLNDAKQKGKDTEKINSLAEVRRALQMYATDNGGFPNSTSTLVTKGYISSINKNILYVGRNSNGTSCSLLSCPSYHLAIPLENVGNKVLTADSNGITTDIGAIDGNTKNCLPSGGTPNLCYDIIP